MNPAPKEKRKNREKPYFFAGLQAADGRIVCVMLAQIALFGCVSKETRILAG
jgi:hypothetical protein